MSGAPPSASPLITADASTLIQANPTATGIEAPPDPAQTRTAPGTTDALRVASHQLPVRPQAAQRYELIAEHGRGGLGRVSRAHDRELGRDVAIKELISPGAIAEARFLREAMITARLEHPGIVPVHEAGRWPDGRPFYAMKLVAGRPLRDLIAERPTVEARLGLLHHVIAVADAIAYAHGGKIIHRDLKPANVVVGDFGETVVIDWGLAKDLAVDGDDTGGASAAAATSDDRLTSTGKVLGTPAYMAPEQARAEVVDQRADVYAIGAMLWELCTLEKLPPHYSGHRARILRQSRLDRDLAVIVGKALEPDPDRRYRDAGALAADLKAFRAGARIAARRYSLWGRLRLRARRHRALVALSAASLAVVAVVAGLGVRAWLDARAEQARAAERALLGAQLGKATEETEDFLRAAYLAPLHDTRAERERIRQRLNTIAHTQHDLGALGDAMVHEALGRGYLALHAWQSASDELARAGAAGLSTPELHAARGKALAELYQVALVEARRRADKSWVARRERELEQQYLAPAIFELMLGRSSSDSPELIDAQIAMYGRNFAAAEALASTAVAQSPWRYEGDVLAGQAAYTAGNALLDRGEYDEARRALERASAHYAKAIEFARSDASLYEAAGQTRLHIAVIEGRRNLSSRDNLERGLEHAERALLAAPDVVSGYLLKGELLHEWSRQTALNKVLDPRIVLEREAATFTRAIEIAPGDARAWQGLGDAYQQRGIWEQVLGDRGDGQRERWWRRAIVNLDHGAVLQPGDPRIQSDLGWVHRFLGDALDQSARDPLPEYEAARRANEQATIIDPQDVKAWANQVDLWVTIADHLYAIGADPQSALASAQHAGDRGLALDRNFRITLENLVRTDLSLVRYLLDVGGDTAVPLLRIQNHLERFDRISPGTMEGSFYHAMLDALVAEARVHDGLDPEAVISSARRAIARALQQQPNWSVCHWGAAQVELVAAAWAERRGADLDAALDRARVEIEKSIAIDGAWPDSQVTAAEISLRLATWKHRPDAAARGLAYADRALALSPRLAKARALRTQLQQLVAGPPP